MPVQEKIVLELPVGAQIIRVDDVEGLFFLWAIVDVDEDQITQTERRFIELYKTGQLIEDSETLVYLGLCKLFIMQELGLYTFERLQV